MKWLSHNWEVVHAETIDTLVSQNQLSKVDWIKVDVEQAEVEVFQGAEGTILEMKPGIIVEVWLQNDRKMRASANKIGYGAVQISPLRHPGSAFYWLLTLLTTTCTY